MLHNYVQVQSCEEGAVCYRGLYRVQQRGVPTAVTDIKDWIVANANSSLA